MKLTIAVRAVVTFLVGLLLAAAAHAVPTIVVAPGVSPAGYVPLSAFGIAPIAGMGDETITNFIVPSFSYAGQSWNQLGVVSNGYVVVGGGTGADVQFVNTDLPNAVAPGNILAPFWTDLNPAAGGEIRIAVLTSGLDTWIVVDWAAVRTFADVEFNTFEVWIGIDSDANPAEDISFTYGAVGNGDGGFLTVGAQDVSRTVGDAYYFNGTGTLPVNGTELRVTTRDLPVAVPAPIPEPGTLALLGLGLAGFAAARRSRQ